MKQLTTQIVLVVLLSIFASSPLTGQEWTRFHGPNGQGVSTLKSFPAKWQEKDYNWNFRGIYCCYRRVEPMGSS